MTTYSLYRWFFSEDQGSRHGSAVAKSEVTARKRVGKALGVPPESLCLDGVFSRNVTSVLEGESDDVWSGD